MLRDASYWQNESFALFKCHGNALHWFQSSDCKSLPAGHVLGRYKVEYKSTVGSRDFIRCRAEGILLSLPQVECRPYHAITYSVPLGGSFRSLSVLPLLFITSMF